MTTDPLTTTQATLTRPVVQLVRQAVLDFNLIDAGDRIAVGMSGGKDSLLLAVALRELSEHDDLDFEFQPVHLDQNQPGFDREGFRTALDQLDLECEIIDRDTHSVVQSQLEPGQIPCALCSRMRRGILNEYCRRRGYTKLAMGHHLDDALETFFLNLFYGRRLEPLKPLTPTQRRDVDTIRPLILVEERKISAWVEDYGITTVDCPVCDAYPESRRRDLKRIIGEFAHLQDDIHASVRSALYDDTRVAALFQP